MTVSHAPPAVGRRFFLSMAAAGALQGCTPASPWRIGYLGDLAHRTAGDGLEGRNAAILGVEELNEQGGIQGRRIELVVQDEGTSAQATQAAMQALLAARVDAIVGPFTSTSAIAALPLADAHRTLMLSPTATAMSLAGRDDFLIRINRTTRDNAADYARVMYRLGQRRAAVAYDQDNAAFSTSWLAEFRAAFTALGAAVVAGNGYASRNAPAFSRIVTDLLVTHPDCLLFISNSFDVAHLSQQAHKLAPGMAIAASEWASYKALSVFGGGAVDGLLLAQAYNPVDPSPRYQKFRTTFLQRFGQEPGFNAVTTYDAIRVLAQALERAGSGEVPRDAVLRHGPYEGLQQRIAFDRFGDTRRAMQFLQVRNGQFESLA